MAGRIPMAITEILPESVKENVVVLGKFLQFGNEDDHRYPCSRAQQFDPVVRIEQVCYAKPSLESFPGFRIGKYLGTIAESNDDKPRTTVLHLIAKFENQILSYAPRIVPYRIRRFKVNEIVSVQLLRSRK